MADPPGDVTQVLADMAARCAGCLEQAQASPSFLAYEYKWMVRDRVPATYLPAPGRSATSLCGTIPIITIGGLNEENSRDFAGNGGVRRTGWQIDIKSDGERCTTSPL